MATVNQEEKALRIETDCYQATIQTEGYVSGVSAGSFIDKRTGVSDLSFGLCIVDFLLEPGADDEETPADFRYHWGDAIHGDIPKRYVELPQICTQARKLPYEIVEDGGFVAVQQWFNWDSARLPYTGGSLWEQWLVFPDGVRWFLAYDKVTSVNAIDSLILRMDMPGHIKHQKGDDFDRIYLSYHDYISSKAFIEDFPPDASYLYQRQTGKIPKRFIRAYQLPNGTWLAGMALDPSIVYEAWCHQRGYVCMIQEIGGSPIRAGESFGAVHLVGFFESIEEMKNVFDTYQGAKTIRVETGGWTLET
ncbi:TPA: hypothetical protein EYN98_16990 [Candidatus Poribacteria bacterium]|jgi:hypothetical protein|nr:hypothetical protein [Candidatus Poribacteria bacterium]HIA67715.1 hypothetical protein [Candidatus Poribacteria bacterium]HIB87303.1 hypothetical protein [Candidatus Poribacteria bacterium]HIB98873.1 hypothetical protein [Candidatus Poribacteria bacterium]HIN28327.1 hypothetical protein [Candidatus Poribacteria bacterium]